MTRNDYTYGLGLFHTVHHRGGVGMGVSLQVAIGCGASTIRTADALRCPFWIRGRQVVRRRDAGCDRARRVAQGHGVKIQMIVSAIQ